MAPGGFEIEDGEGPVTRADVLTYLDGVAAEDDPLFPSQLVAEVRKQASRELRSGEDPEAVLERVFTALHAIAFNQPRSCECGAVLADGEWRGTRTITCSSCGTSWRIRVTDNTASISRRASN
jgi:hypothetical protein